MPKGKKQIKIEILMGLPGSGKTTYAQKLNSPYDKQIRVVNCDSLNIEDEYWGWGTPPKKNPNETKETKFHNKLMANIRGYFTGTNHIIVDGLFLTNADVEKVLKGLVEIQDDYGVDLKFQITHWAEDREACLWNDIKRRDVDSETTIKNATFEKPNTELLQKYKIKLVEKNVVRKTLVQKVAEEKKLSIKDGYLLSDSWSLGGTWGSYTGASGRVDPEPPPASFVAFDELLEALCPNITFLQYKKLFNETVTTDTENQGDYYGGSTSRAFYRCDISRLMGMLEEMGVIKDV